MLRKTYDVEVKEKREDGGRILISTPVVDRDGDRLMPKGLRTENYMKNPVVQYGHNYREPWATIGKTLALEVTKEGVVADFELRPAANDSDPQHIVRLLWEGGWIRTASVGFDRVPGETEAEKEADPFFVENEFGGKDYLSWDLLEWSLVPVPANQDALRLAVKGLDTGPDEGGVGEIPEEPEAKTVIPYADHGTDTGSWSAPGLAQFAADPMGELSPAERRRIAAHFTWSENMPPEAFSDLKLPHHRGGQSGVGPAVWAGVAAAMAALLGARGGVDIPGGDRRRVYGHLSQHYAQFDKEPPEFRDYSEAELKELFPEVVEGVAEVEDALLKEPEPETDDAVTDELPPEVLDALEEVLNDARELYEIERDTEVENERED